MNSKQAVSVIPHTAIAVLLFLLALANLSWGDDKHKPASAPKAAPARTAPAAHPSSGASHGSGGRPSGGSSSGRPSVGNAGRPSVGSNSSHGNANSGANGRPGSTAANNGRNSGVGNNSRNTGAANNVKNASSGSKGGNTGAANNRDRNAGEANTGTGNNGRNASAGNNGKNVGTGHNPPRHEAIRNVREVGGRRVATDTHGHVREIHGRNGMEIRRDVHGERRFEAQHNGRRVVGYGRDRGYSERTYLRRGGHVYVQRTYIYGGRRYAYAYRSYYYRGYPYYGYAPAFYYRPVFYGWAYDPWAAPVYYNWGWGGSPWFVGYGYYFNPYPVYPSASLWLTDYLLAENLKAAYEARGDAAAIAQTDTGGGQVALSPEVKQMIADEVQRQLAAERAAASQSPTSGQAAPTPPQPGSNQLEETPAALDPNQRVFVVASNLDLIGDSGDECAVTAGDVLVRSSNEPNGNKVGVSVVSSKKGDCAVGTASEVEISELQEMHNQFREKLDSGLKTLADNQGKNGLPKAPDTTTTAGEVPPPAADAGAEAELQSVQKNADQEEQEVQKNPGQN